MKSGVFLVNIGFNNRPMPEIERIDSKFAEELEIKEK